MPLVIIATVLMICCEISAAATIMFALSQWQRNRNLAEWIVLLIISLGTSTGGIALIIAATL